MGATLAELLAEGNAVPVEGWDFSWFEGRATEERPAWGYSRIVAERMAAAAAALDIQTGGGEVLAGLPRLPALTVATEPWLPNVDVARRNLRPRGAAVVAVASSPALPFRSASFDLVVSRHPVGVLWDEIARVLRPGGVFISQLIGAANQRELKEAMRGPLAWSDEGSPDWYAAAAERAGLTVVDLRTQALRTVFHDIAAVVYFLRKVLWTVPGFTVDQYREQLTRVHEQIRRDGSFVSHAQRVLIEVRRPS